MPLRFLLGIPIRDNPVSSHFLALAHQIVHRGHEVAIITPQRRLDLVNLSSNPAILTWPSSRPTRVADARFLHQFLRRRVPDCVVAHFSAVNLMMVVGRIAKVRARVAWYHTLSTQIDADTRTSRFRRVLLQCRKALVYRCATHIACNSSASCDDVHQRYSVAMHKCSVQPNSLEDPLTNALGPTLSRRADYLVCVGRLFPSKGQDVLIRALGRLAKGYQHLRVRFIGGGPSLEQFRMLAEQTGVSQMCEFCGILTHDDVLREMAGAALTVVPSRSEAFGLVNIESMAVGTPIIASSVGGIRDIIEDGHSGYLVPPDDPQALADRILRLLTDATLRTKMGHAARARFLERYELKAVVTRQADWLEGLAQGSNR